MIDIYALYLQFYDILLNSTNKYLTALLILASFYVIYKLFLIITKKVILKITEKTPTDLDRKMVEATEGPVSYILFMIGVKLAIVPFELVGVVGFYSGKIANSIIILLIGLLIIRIATVMINGLGAKWAKKTKSSLDDALIPVADKFSKIVIGIFALMFVLQSWNINITSLLAGVGIAGLAIGFAIKDSLSNIFGGISLILDKAVRVGDRVEIGDISGVVADVGIRSTKIKTWDNDLVVVPNGYLGNSIIKNHQLPNKRARVIIKFGVAYGTKHEKVRKIAVETLKKVKHILDDPAPYCRFCSMGDSALDFKLYFYVDDISNKFGIEEVITSKLYDALNKAKIEIPYPQMDVHVKRK